MDLHTRLWVCTYILISMAVVYTLKSCQVRRILIDDPEFIFPPSLQQVTLYRSMQSTSGIHAAISKKKMNVSGQPVCYTESRCERSFHANQRSQIFYMVMTITFAWQFLPEFLFPMVAALAPLCWFAPDNHQINFLGAGAKGIGLLNITLDWSNITSKVITYPYSVQVVIFVGFVITVCCQPRAREVGSPVAPGF